MATSMNAPCFNSNLVLDQTSDTYLLFGGIVQFLCAFRMLEALFGYSIPERKGFGSKQRGTKHQQQSLTSLRSLRLVHFSYEPRWVSSHFFRFHLTGCHRLPRDHADRISSWTPGTSVQYSDVLRGSRRAEEREESLAREDELDEFAKGKKT